MSRPLFSVVICTYNRAWLLATVLQSVCEQQLAGAEYEVIVIDNHSTDGTAALCHTFAARYAGMRYCLERQQGVSHARNRGWREAQGIYVAYVDDECKTPPGWLAAAKTVIEQVGAEVLGGPYYAFYDRPKPAWFMDMYGSSSLWVQDEAGVWSEVMDGQAIDPNQLHGGNLFFRRDLLDLAGGFDTTLGMHGDQTGYGEETACLLRLHTIRPATRFYYEPKLRVYHLVRPEKLSLWWQLRSIFLYGRARYPVYLAGQHPFTRLQLLFWPPYTLLIGVQTLFHCWFWRDRNRFPYWQNALLDSKAVHYYWRHLGTWAAYVEAHGRSGFAACKKLLAKGKRRRQEVRHL